jgi:hypothetical protein
MARKITVAVYRVSEDGTLFPPTVESIDASLESMQKVVGGYIELVRGPMGLDLWCNEEGLLMNLPIQHRAGFQPLAGNFFLARADHKRGESISLTAKDLADLGLAQLA